MSVHKVPQDVEAEDKLIGPFSFKQLILLLIAGFLGFIMVVLARISLFLIIIPLPFFLIFLFFGIYRRKDQSVETYVSAILRFYFKPRKRIWSKDGILETVIITAPKQVAGIAIDNMNNMEVKNRLATLGQLMDTRGWSAKNATMQEGAMAMNLAQSDRLVVPIVQMEPTEVHDSDDMLNDYASSTAQNIAARTSAMHDEARAAAVQRMQQAATTPATVSVQTPAYPEIHYQPAPTMQQSVVAPITSTVPVVDTTAPIPQTAYASPDQADVLAQSFQQPAPAPASTPAPDSSASVMTTDVPTDILNLSRNNDRNIESIAKEADKILESGDTISLHGH